jgi:thioredoxin-dependent peroxiredoxin
VSPEEGAPAPDFELENDSGERVRLSSLRGRPVVLYFYPRDDTPEHEAAERYGVWVETKNCGRTSMGIERSTFVIAADGTLEKIMQRVNPRTHADAVLAALAEQQGR